MQPVGPETKFYRRTWDLRTLPPYIFIFIHHITW